ncbi:unnamed protein product [Caenorhabditis auriculariae]|uniref:Regulatory protein zeste n=1 Tax=Caenorhabditis auriculariae TaxID=2777116 RepID=A0A8S1HBD6_9PELO|nr:unnamed protein product [Caenorhabditis auriculariae]
MQSVSGKLFAHLKRDCAAAGGEMQSECSVWPSAACDRQTGKCQSMALPKRLGSVPTDRRHLPVNTALSAVFANYLLGLSPFFSFSPQLFDRPVYEQEKEESFCLTWERMNLSVKTFLCVFMDQILAMVKHAGDDPPRSLNSFESHESIGLGSSTSTSEDLSMSGEWADRDFEADEGKNAPEGSQTTTYRIFMDSLVAKHKNVLFGECDGHEVTPRSKEEAWKKVALEVEGLGLESYKGKPWARLRDHDWQYVRRHALARNENSSKPTGMLADLDKIVLDIIATTSINSLTPTQVYNLNATQSSENMELVLRQLLSKADSVDSKESFNVSLERPDEDFPKGKLEETVASSTQLSGNSEALFDILNKVSHRFPLGIESNGAVTPSTKTNLTSVRKMTSRSATAPSVYSITSSTSPTQSVPGPPSKKSKIESERSLSPAFEKKKEAFELKKIELEIRHMELVNEKLVKEIAALEGRERRACELHAMEMRAVKARLLRGAAVDETSVDLVDSPPRRYLNSAF